MSSRTERNSLQVTTGSYIVLLFGSVSYFCFVFSWFLLPAFLGPIISDLDLSSTQAGLLTGAIPLVYIPLSLISGLTIDRIGSRRAIGFALILFGLGQAVRGLAADFPTFLLLTIIIGIGGTGITFGLPKLVSELFPPERSGTMSSVYVVGASLGSASAFGIGRPFLGPWFGGWRQVFVGSGVAIVSFVVIWITVLALFFPKDGGSTSPNGNTDSGPTPRSLKRDIEVVVSHRDLRLVVVIGTMYLLINHGLQAWLTTILEVRGFSSSVAATVTSLLIIARLSGTVTIPYLSDSMGSRRATVMACGILTAVGIAGLLQGGELLWFTVLVVVIVGIGLGGLSPLIRSLPIEMDGIGPKLTATATGLVFTVGEIGGFAGPFLVGALQDVTRSYTAGLALLFGGCLVILATGFLMNEPET